MYRRLFGLVLAITLALVALYLSRFWPFAWWGRDGLLGIEALPPGGDLLRGWLRGTWAAPYDLIIWCVGGFAALSLAQRVRDWIRSE